MIAAGIVIHRPDLAQLDALLSALEVEDWPVFVFLNGPVAPPVMARLQEAGARIEAAPDNLGLGHGLNALMQAAAEAGLKALVTFDQDSVPPPELLLSLAARFANLPKGAAALGPRLVAPQGEHYLAPWYGRRGAAGPGVTAVDFLPTSGTYVSLAAWRAVGPFRADYFIDGIDVEWCLRAWSRGRGCYLAEDLTMPHRWGGATPEPGRKPQILRQSLPRSYYYLRNAVAGLRLAHLPPSWRARSAARIAAQALLLALVHPQRREARRIVAAALRDGWRGRLGPIPPELG